MFNWVTRREGRGRGPTDEEKAKIKARLERLSPKKPEATPEEDLPEIDPSDSERIEDAPPADKVLRYLDAKEKFAEKQKEETALEDQYEALKADKGEDSPEAKAVATMLEEVGVEFDTARQEMDAAGAAVSKEEKDLVDSATTLDERNQLRMDRAAAAAASKEKPKENQKTKEEELPEIDPRDMELIKDEESPEAKDTRWFGGLRDSVSRFVKRHTTGAVDQREELSQSEKLRGGAVQLAEGLLGGVASVAGVKLAYDMTLGLSQEYFTRAERQALIEDIQKKFQGIETMEGKREGNAELATRFSAIESRIDSSEHLSAAQKRELKEKLGAIIDEDNKSRRAAFSERDDQVRALFEGAIKSRITGAGIAKEALNTAMAATGITALRGGVMLGFSAAEAYRAASKELQSEKEKVGFADVAKKAFADSWSTYKDEVTGQQGVMGIGRAASKTVRVLGFGAMLGSGLVDVAQGDAHERIDRFLNNWGNTSDNMAASADRATLGGGGRIVDMVSGGGEVSEEIASATAGRIEDLPATPLTESEGGESPVSESADVPRESYLGTDGEVLERPVAGYADASMELGGTFESFGATPEAFEEGLVRAGDGISQAIARQIDTMPEEQFKALAARYGFTGDRDFKTDIFATGENRFIPKGSLLDNERLGEYKAFIARVTQEIVKDNEAYMTEKGMLQEGFSNKAVGEISAVLVPDASKPSGFDIKYFEKDGTLIKFDESEYNLEGNWNGTRGVSTSAAEMSGRAVEASAAAPEVASGLSDTGKIIKETVYKVGGKTVTFDGSRAFLDGVEVDLGNLNSIPEGDTLRKVIEVRSDVLNVTDQLYQAATAGDKETAARLLAELRSFEQEKGAWGFTVDIPNDALDHMQEEYGRYVEASTPSEAGTVNEIAVAREASTKAAKITFEHSGGKVVGADLSKFRVIGKDLDIAREEAKEGLNIDLNDPAARVRTLMPDVKRYYVLSRLEEALDAGKKGKSAEAAWVRDQLEKLYTKYNPPGV